MKPAQYRELSVNELNEKIEGMEEEHFNLRFQDKLGQLSNPLQLRMLKRDIARAHTVLNQKKNEAAVTNA